MMIKSRRMRLAEHVARTEQMRSIQHFSRKTWSEETIWEIKA